MTEVPGDPAGVGHDASGSRCREHLHVVTGDQTGKGPRQGRVAEDHDALDLLGEFSIEEETVGADGVGAHAPAGRRLGEQRPAGPFGEDARRGAAAVARDDDGALAPTKHLRTRTAAAPHPNLP